MNVQLKTELGYHVMNALILVLVNNGVSQTIMCDKVKKDVRGIECMPCNGQEEYKHST